MRGIGKLETPRDLLEKLRHDFGRLTAAPSDSYIAFDFFVTAEHMLDWVLPGKANKKARQDLRSRHPLLQAVSHIANSSKHQVAESPHHHHVHHVDAPPPAFDPDVFDARAFQTGALSITLEGSAELAFGRYILAIDLTNSRPVSKGLIETRLAHLKC